MRQSDWSWKDLAVIFGYPAMHIRDCVGGPPKCRSGDLDPHQQAVRELRAAGYSEEVIRANFGEVR